MDRGQGMDRRKATETRTGTGTEGQRDNSGGTVTDRTGTG